MAQLKEVMEEEEKVRLEVKGHPSLSPGHGTWPTAAAKSTTPGDSCSEGEGIDDNMATAGIEGLKLEEEEEERKRDMMPTAGNASSSDGDSDDEDIALSSLLRCACYMYLC